MADIASTVLSQTSEPVGDVLGSIRVTGAVLSVAHLEAPFAVNSGIVPTGVFHAVLSGSAWASVTGSDSPVRLGPGQVAVFPGGAEHVIASDHEPTVPPVPVSASGDGPLPSMRVQTGGPPTEILCGTITFAESPVLSMTDALPDMVVTGVDDANGWVRSTVELITEELVNQTPASAVVAARLADVLVVRALREMVHTGLGGGWADGVRDPHLAGAVAAVHRDPAGPWTVATLARLASMSRSSFYERFTRVVGLPPGEYVARWRIHVACDRLATTSDSIAAIGRSVGFTTEPGFSTAFKRLVGVPPSAYRRAARDG